MRNRKVAVAVCLVGVLSLLAIPFTIACGNDQPPAIEIELQEPIEVPMIVEVDQSNWCDDCVRQPVRNVLERKTVRRVIVERPAVETFVQVTRERRARRKPVRSLLRRLFSR